MFALTAAGDFASFADAAIKHVLAGFGELNVHPDVPAGMRALRDGGLRLFTMTNGSALLTGALLTRAGLLDLIEVRLDVSGPRIWKPAPDAYRYVADYAGVAMDEAALVAVHPWDVHGAQRAGTRRGLARPRRMSLSGHHGHPGRDGARPSLARRRR